MVSLNDRSGTIFVFYLILFDFAVVTMNTRDELVVIVIKSQFLDGK